MDRFKYFLKFVLQENQNQNDKMYIYERNIYEFYCNFEFGTRNNVKFEVND